MVGKTNRWWGGGGGECFRAPRCAAFPATLICPLGFFELSGCVSSNRSFLGETLEGHGPRNIKKSSQCEDQNSKRQPQDFYVNGFHFTSSSAATNKYPTPRTVRISARLPVSSFFLKWLIWTSMERSNGVASLL